MHFDWRIGLIWLSKSTREADIETASIDEGEGAMGYRVSAPTVNIAGRGILCPPQSKRKKAMAITRIAARMRKSYSRNKHSAISNQQPAVSSQQSAGGRYSRNKVREFLLTA